MMRSELIRFGRGFIYAWNGIRAAVQEERNFRFHICAAIYVYVLATLAGFEPVEYAIVSLCVFSVMAAELMNSAVERAVDKPDTTHWWSAGAAKDMAAGAVMVTALGAVVVAVCLFFNTETIGAVWAGITGSPMSIVLWLVSFVAAYLFVFRYHNRKERGAPTKAPEGKK